MHATARESERSAVGVAAPARRSSGRASPAAVALALQRAAGNRAVSCLVRQSRPLQLSCSCSGDDECGCTARKDGAAADVGTLDAGVAAPASSPPAAVKKTVRIFPLSLGSSTRDPYPDIKRADEIWSQCGVKVTGLIGQCSTSKVLDTQAPNDVLNEFSDPASPTTEETAMLALKPGGSGIFHAYYVPRMSAGSRGEAFTPTVNKTSAAVISDSAASDSLAHEIGHVLLDSGSHNQTDPDDLMASGSIRNVGVDKLNATQCAKAVA